MNRRRVGLAGGGGIHGRLRDISVGETRTSGRQRILRRSRRCVLHTSAVLGQIPTFQHKRNLNLKFDLFRSTHNLKIVSYRSIFEILIIGIWNHATCRPAAVLLL